MARSVNKVILVGNLTRDPEMRYTPQGHAVTTFGVATNRDWKVEGEAQRREETEFHTVVAWNKLAELCNQLLKKGTKVYIEGRLQTRDWTDDKGTKHYRTEVVAEDMIVLSGKREGGFSEESGESFSDEYNTSSQKEEKPKKGKKKEEASEDIDLEEIPF